MAASQDGNTAFVTDRASGLVSIVDLRSRSVLRTQRAAAANLYPVVSPTGQDLFVAGEGSRDILVLDAAGQLKRTIPAGPASTGVGFSPTGDVVYLPRHDKNELAILDAASGAAKGSVSLPGAPSGLGISRDGTKAYVALKSMDRVAVVDLTKRSLITQVSVESGPTRVAVSPLQPKPQSVPMPGALPNTGGESSPPLPAAAALVVGLLVLGTGLAAWRRTRARL